MKSLRLIIAALLLITGVVLVYFVMTNKALPEFIQVDKISVGNVRLSPQPSFDLGAELEFNNPNRFGLTIQEVSCDIYLEGSKVTRIEHKEKIDVPASGHFYVPFQAPINLSEQEYKKIFGSNLFSSLLNNELNMRFEGAMTLSKFGISRKVSFQYDYKHKIL